MEAEVLDTTCHKEQKKEDEEAEELPRPNNKFGSNSSFAKYDLIKFIVP